MPCQVLPCQGTTHRNWAFRLLLSLDNVLDSLRWRFQLHEAPNYGRWFPRQGLVEKSGHWKTEDVRYSGNRWARVCGQQGKKGADEWMNGWIGQRCIGGHPSLLVSIHWTSPPTCSASTYSCKENPFSPANYRKCYQYQLKILIYLIGHSISFCVETTGHVKLLDNTPSLLAKQFCPKILGKNRQKPASLRSV